MTSAPIRAIVTIGCILQLAAHAGCRDGRSRLNDAPGLGSNTPSWVEGFAAQARPADCSRPHVILISLDTLRADHLGAWGYERATSPFLDALARTGVRFSETISHSPKTAPSHMSVFTGAFPTDHEAHFDYGDSDAQAVAIPGRRSLPTLPEIMRDAGYQTAAWTGGGQMSGSVGFDRGFEEFSTNLGTVRPAKMQIVRTWFRDHAERPCFIFLHTYQIHDPYLPPSPYEVMFSEGSYDGWIVGRKEELAGSDVHDFATLHKAFWRNAGDEIDVSLFEPADVRRLVELYDGGIRYTDDVLLGFFEDLHDDGLLANTLVVVFSDHGEEFLEHGGFLHSKLYREALHVPLIFFWPGGLPRGLDIRARIPLMDLTPTLLELVDVDPPRHSNARSLMPLILGSDRNQSRAVFSEEPWVHAGHHRSYREGEYMLYDHGDNSIELFDTVTNPVESVDLSTRRPELVAEMIQRMTAFLGASATPLDQPAEVAQELTEEEVEALRALGYIQ